MHNDWESGDFDESLWKLIDWDKKGTQESKDLEKLKNKSLSEAISFLLSQGFDAALDLVPVLGNVKSFVGDVAEFINILRSPNKLLEMLYSTAEYAEYNQQISDYNAALGILTNSLQEVPPCTCKNKDHGCSCPTKIQSDSILKKIDTLHNDITVTVDDIKRRIEPVLNWMSQFERIYRPIELFVEYQTYCDTQIIEEVGESYKEYSRLKEQSEDERDSVEYNKLRKKISESINTNFTYFRKIYLQIVSLDSTDDRQKREKAIDDTIVVPEKELPSYNACLCKKEEEEDETVSSPIVLDLNGNGTVDTKSLGDGAYFDHNNDGFKIKTGWVGEGDGLLVRDLDGNGIIDNGSELFGSNTYLKNGKKASNGFVALAELDENKDGRIDENDTAWNSLRVWVDRNGDGVADAGELLSMKEAGVAALNTEYTNGRTTDENGNRHLQEGMFIRDNGTTGAMNDIWFVTNPRIKSPCRRDNAHL